MRAAFEAHARGISALAARILRDPEEARDVCQETFVRYFDRMDEVNGDPGPWLRSVAWRLSVDRLRHAGREARAIANRSSPLPSHGSDSAEASEVRERVLGAVSTLPRRQRDVVVMRVLGAETFVAIARALGISEGAAKVHLRRGIEHLRRLLAPLAGAKETSDELR